MKSNVRTFKNLQVCLGECQRFVRNPQILYTGNKIERFAWMLPREIWGNWIIAAICSEGRDEELRITTDPNGGDGVIWDPATEVGWRVEHTLVPLNRGTDTRPTDQRIIEAIDKKKAKGPKYAEGKILVVLNESGIGDQWRPTAVARALPPNDFIETWVLNPDAFEHASVTYSATKLELVGARAPVYKVRINSLFTRWRVEQTQ